ncbi:MAG: MFS transporter, partial [Lachnospiraceae bacterium]|nr:MFS transporter [Lachnospiraceae bacterium]
NRAVAKHENKVKLTALNGVYIIIISTVLSIVIPQFVAAAGVDPKSWSFMAIVIAIPMMLIGLLRFIFCKEIVSDDTSVKLDIKEGASVIFKNKYIWIFGIMYFGYHFVNTLSGTAQTYYFQYELGDIGFSSYVGMGMMLVPFLLAAVPKLMSKFGTRNVLRTGIILIGVGPLLRMIFGTNPITLVVFSIVFLIGTVPVGFMSTVYVFECIDYSVWKTGRRVEAMFSAVNSFFAKIASAFASAGVGLVMGAVGYQGGAATQNAATMTAIHGLYNIAPIIVSIIMLIACHFYDVEKLLPDIRAELAQKQTTAD